MRLLTVAALIMLPLAAGAATPAKEAPAAPEASTGAAEPLSQMNVYRLRPGCESIPQQVAGEDREYDATRLDRLPPGKLLLAVEREVDGCPQATLAGEERRRQLGGAGR